MSYKEPSVYLSLENNPKYNTGTTPVLIPAIVGDGPSSLIKTVAIVRSSQTYDVLPAENVTGIIKVGNLKDSTDYTPTTDYILQGSNQIEWTGTGSQPVEGDTYYVTFEYTPSNDWYTPALVSSKTEVIEKYGPDVDDNGNINPVSLGAQIALEENNLVYILPVKPAGAEIASSDYKAAYDTYLRFLPGVYRVIPMTLDAQVNLETITHVNLMSTDEEKMERVTILGADHASTDASSVITNVGGYAEGLNNKRVCVIYPDKATRTLSDGNLYTLDAPFVCAALAGWKSGRPPQRAYTKGQLTNFYELKGINLTRAQKNMLASKGVMILEQPSGPGTPIVIRHGLTTDMSSVQTREASVVEIGDYVSKYLRDGLKNYIGAYNITPDLITRLKGTTNSLLSILKSDNIIVDGRVTELYQDEVSPDTIVMKVAIDVPYPCNYIEITLFLD